MSDQEFTVGDTVVFRQVKPEEYDPTRAYDFVEEDGTTYTIHRGDVGEYIDSDPAAVRVAWDDGSHTTTPVSELHQPTEVDWYNE